MTNLNIFFIYT